MFNLFGKKESKIICYDQNYFSPTDKIIELEEKINSLEKRLESLEYENVETSNTLYEITHQIDAVDTRIDILTAEKFLKEDV